MSKSLRSFVNRFFPVKIRRDPDIDAVRKQQIALARRLRALDTQARVKARQKGSV